MAWYIGLTVASEENIEAMSSSFDFKIDENKNNPMGAFISNIYIDHEERKVPKYKNHKLRERKVKTLTRN